MSESAFNETVFWCKGVASLRVVVACCVVTTLVGMFVFPIFNSMPILSVNHTINIRVFGLYLTSILWLPILNMKT